MPIERYPAQIRVTRVLSSPTMGCENEEIYRGNAMHIQRIPLALKLHKDSDRNYFYILKRADLIDDATVEVMQAVYDLTELNEGKMHKLKYHSGDNNEGKIAEFSFNGEKSLDEFLDEDLE